MDYHTVFMPSPFRGHLWHVSRLAVTSDTAMFAYMLLCGHMSSIFLGCVYLGVELLNPMMILCFIF